MAAPGWILATAWAQSVPPPFHSPGPEWAPAQSVGGRGHHHRRNLRIRWHCCPCPPLRYCPRGREAPPRMDPPESEEKKINNKDV